MIRAGIFVILTIFVITSTSCNFETNKKKVILHYDLSENSNCGAKIVELNKRFLLLIVDRYAAGKSDDSFYKSQVYRISK